MTTDSSSANFAIFLVLLAAFVWVAVKFADMPMVVGAAGLLLVGFLTLIWLPSAREKAKKTQKPDGRGNSDFFG